MTYRLLFKKDAKKEWDKLNATVRSIFAEKLKERISHPRIENFRLCEMKDCYKNKAAPGRILFSTYQVRDEGLVVSVVAVGKREKNLVYKTAIKRI